MWIKKNGRELIAWYDFVKKLSRAKRKAKIQNNQDLNQDCYRGKRPLKLIKKARDKQLEKTQLKPSGSLSGQINAQIKKENKAKKAKREKTKKKKKKKAHKKRQKRQKGSTSAT